MTKRKQSNLTFRPTPEGRRVKEGFLKDSQCLEYVDWKGRPFLFIYENLEFNPEDPLNSPEVERFFIRTAQEAHLRVFHGYAATVQQARDLCEVVARDFEKFLNAWHNTKALQPAPRPDTPIGESSDSSS